MSWLGLAGYYRQFLSRYSKLMSPLTELLKKSKTIAWCGRAENSVVELMSMMASRPILRSPDYSKTFCLAVGASQFCVGGCLFQVFDNVEHIRFVILVVS